MPSSELGLVPRLIWIMFPLHKVNSVPVLGYFGRLAGEDLDGNGLVSAFQYI